MTGALRRGGAPAGAGVAFLRKKLRKNLFGKGFLGVNGVGANIERPFLRGRAQYLPKAKTVSGERFFLVCPFIFEQNNF